MSILIFASQATLDDIMCTPDIEGGCGPVMIGTPVRAPAHLFFSFHPSSAQAGRSPGESPDIQIRGVDFLMDGRNLGILDARSLPSFTFHHNYNELFILIDNITCVIY